MDGALEAVTTVNTGFPIPGTHEPGFVQPRITEVGDVGLRGHLTRAGARGLHFYVMGDCRMIVAREPAGAGGEMLWHLSISCIDRHPSWDEIKTARYRLLPLNLCVGMLLPPPAAYVNVPEQDNVFHLWEITDPREPWTGQ